jgi:hypothetical protein
MEHASSVPTSRLTISLPQGSPLSLELMSENSNSTVDQSTNDGSNFFRTTADGTNFFQAPNDGSNTAPIFVGPSDAQRPRHFSFGNVSEESFFTSVLLLLTNFKFKFCFLLVCILSTSYAE